MTDHYITHSARWANVKMAYDKMYISHHTRNHIVRHRSSTYQRVLVPKQEQYFVDDYRTDVLRQSKERIGTDLPAQCL